MGVCWAAGDMPSQFQTANGKASLLYVWLTDRLGKAYLLHVLLAERSRQRREALLLDTYGRNGVYLLLFIY